MLRKSILAAVFALASAAAPTPARAEGLPTVDANYDARNCELFVNSLGLEVRHYGGGGYDQTTHVSYVSVNESDLVQAQGGAVLRVGLLANGKDVALGQRIEPAYYKIRLDLRLLRAYQGIDYKYELKDFLYFVDVQRRGGEVVRLWLKDGAQHFQWPSVYENFPKWWETAGPNGDVYVLDPSPIYNQKHACGH